MKAIVNKEDLLSHRKRMRLVKLPKRLKQSVDITITISEGFSVTCPGFLDDMAASVEEWGTASLPYNLWEHIVENVIPAMSEKKIPISVETFSISVGGMRINNARISVIRPDRVSLDIPADAEPMEVLRLALEQDSRAVRNSVAWRYVKAARDQVRRQFERACTPLRRYGVTPEELARLVAVKLGVQNEEAFLEFIFPDHP